MSGGNPTDKLNRINSQQQYDVVPGPVGQPFSGEALTMDSCKLTWSSPEDNGGSAITNYIIEKRESDPMGWTSVSYTGTGNNTVVQGLIDGKGYVFRIAAKNVIGMGPFIETDKMVLITEPNSVPKPPEKLEVKAITKESVTVAWRTPEYDGGCEVTGYVLEASLQGKDHFSRVGADSDLLEKTFTHAGLKKGSSYEFRVAAVNKVGQGSFSFVTKPVQCKDELGKLLNFFVVKTGETCGAHETFVKKLKLKGQIQKKSVDQSDYILAFCPSPSRTGTDVQEAMGKIPRGKPVILVVMHHRHDVEAYLDDSSRHVSREDVILTVDTLFWEGAFLTCSHNKKAFSKVLNAVGPSSSILRFFGETFGEKRLSNMDVPSSNSPGEPTTSSSENKNRKRDTESKVKTPWRDANFENKDILLKSVKEFHPENKHVRILLLGPKDSGKSSFINSVSSILRGRMVHGEPVDPIDKTIKYQTHTIKKGNKQKQNYPFVFNDIMGLGSETGVLEEDMKLSLEGHVKDGYTFNPALPLSKEDPDYYKKKNTPEDKTHVLVLVIPADQVTTSSPDSMKKMKDIAVNMGIPQICILTKIDEASSLVKENGVKHVYNSKNLQEKMEEVSAKVGIPMESIFPVKNYHEETDLDDDIDVLILTALQHMIDLGKTYTDSMSLE